MENGIQDKYTLQTLEKPRSYNFNRSQSLKSNLLELKQRRKPRRSSHPLKSNSNLTYLTWNPWFGPYPVDFAIDQPISKPVSHCLVDFEPLWALFNLFSNQYKSCIVAFKPFRVVFYWFRSKTIDLKLWKSVFSRFQAYLGYCELDLLGFWPFSKLYKLFRTLPSRFLPFQALPYWSRV